MPSEKKPAKKGSESETEARRFSILFEHMQTDVRRIAEVTELNYERHNAKMEEMKEELLGEIRMTQMVVRSHSAQLQSQSVQLQQLDKKVDGLQKDMTEVKERLDRVETKLDRVAEKVNQHDKDISVLKSAAVLD